MKTYRLTPLDELRLAKKKVREEKAIAEQRLSYQLQYLADNWGTLLTKGVTSSIKTKFTETIDNISHGNSKSVTPFRTQRTPYPWVNIALANLPFIGGIAWKVARPALLTFATRKITNKLLPFKRKKRR